MSPVRVAEVRRLVQSPVDHRHTHLSVRDIAQSMRARRDQHDRPTFGPIRRSTVARIIKKALRLRPLTRQSVHALNDRQQAARLVACRRWLQVRSFFVRFQNNHPLQVEKSGPAPRNADELEVRIQAAWAALPLAYIRNAIDAQPRRIQMVIDNGGGNIAKWAG